MQETKLKLLERIVDRRQDSLYRFAYFRTGSQADVQNAGTKNLQIVTSCDQGIVTTSVYEIN